MGYILQSNTQQANTAVSTGQRVYLTNPVYFFPIDRHYLKYFLLKGWAIKTHSQQGHILISCAPSIWTGRASPLFSQPALWSTLQGFGNCSFKTIHILTLLSTSSPCQAILKILMYSPLCFTLLSHLPCSLRGPTWHRSCQKLSPSARLSPLEITPAVSRDTSASSYLGI